MEVALPVSLGTRSTDNIKAGPVEIYLADGGTISAPGAFSLNIGHTTFAALLANFSHAGTVIGPAPVRTGAKSENVITAPGYNWAGHHLHQIDVEFLIGETDSTILNALLARAEAKTETDFLFVKGGGGIGDSALFILGVIFLIEIDAENTFEAADRARVKISGTAAALADILGQYLIIEEIPS